MAQKNTLLVCGCRGASRVLLFCTKVFCIYERLVPAVCPLALAELCITFENERVSDGDTGYAQHVLRCSWVSVANSNDVRTDLL